MGKERLLKKERRNPLHVQLAEDDLPKRKHYKEKFISRRQNKDKEDEYAEPDLSRKILKIVREQQEEVELENQVYKFKNDQNAMLYSMIDDESDQDDNISDNGDNFEYEELEIDETDQAILDKFLPNAPKERKTLADIIIEKIALQNLDQSSSIVKSGQPSINPKVAEVYTNRYKSGKLPKAFKIIPSLPNWEEILYLTHPENWTPNATFQATKIFVSNLKDKQTQRWFYFMSLVSTQCLNKVRDDIHENKKLNCHLYMALKKALYKPAAFFKGIIFPLCESGTCTLKEAAIIGSVILKVSIPMLHSSAALLRLSEMDYTGSTSLFIRILLDKKYALPFKVVDALVFHFIRFKHDERTMPVLWHQSLLVFAQRYKQDLTPDQKDALLGLVKIKSHYLITPEIRREITNSVARDLIEDIEME
ncbi:13488_t:CDS:2 [Dentiscutata heterogama]|uniref:13488_t:CDS:1 n=1 Tax=Dentiscutata heterogama TaxID=1316150 RepID=A0ACA9NB12_9GLOM|nr:13488_t:CDS:2 [Dentiscutata heterogama]